MDERRKNVSTSGKYKPQQKPKRKKRRINKLRVAILLFVVIFMVAVVIVAVLMVRSSGKANTAQAERKDTVLFGVKSIMVEGSSHYTDEQIIKVSEIYIGQSLFFVNKRRGAENILRKFPYVEKVTINNPSFNQIKIAVKEAKPVGIVKHKNNWLIIGENGKGLEELPEGSSRLKDYRILKCKINKSGGLGCMTFSSRSIDIINSITTVLDKSNLKDVTVIDITDYTNILLSWNNSIIFKMGNDIILDKKLSYAAKTLDRVLKSHGKNASGQIDLSVYTESTPKAIFTPEDLLTADSTPDVPETTADTEDE